MRYLKHKKILLIVISETTLKKALKYNKPNSKYVKIKKKNYQNTHKLPVNKIKI